MDTASVDVIQYKRCLEDAVDEIKRSGRPLPTVRDVMEVIERIAKERGFEVPEWLFNRVGQSMDFLHRDIIRFREKGFVPSVLIDMRGSCIPHGVEVHTEEAPARFCRVSPGTPEYEAAQFEIGTVKASLATTLPVGSKILFSRCVDAILLPKD